MYGANMINIELSFAHYISGLRRSNAGVADFFYSRGNSGRLRQFIRRFVLRL